MFKKILYEHKFKQIGRFPKFFLASDMFPLKKHNLEIWPGYISQVKSLTGGIFLNIDCCTKFIFSTSVLDIISDLQRDRCSKQDIINYLAPKSPDEKRLVVITKYNSRIYQIEDLRFDITPKNHTFKYIIKDPSTETRTIQNGNLL